MALKAVRGEVSPEAGRSIKKFGNSAKRRQAGSGKRVFSRWYRPITRVRANQAGQTSDRDDKRA